MTQHAYPASLTVRLLAFVYDFMLVVAILLIGGALPLIFTGGDAIEPGTVGGFLYQLYLLLLTGGFFVFFWVRGGQTLGMKTWRLRVVTPDGQLIGLRTALVRILLPAIGWVLVFVGLYWAYFSDWSQVQSRGSQHFTLLIASLPLVLMFGWIRVDEWRRGWHDRLANTLVVREPKQPQAAKGD